MKQCTKCKIEKSLEDFSRNKTRKDGRSTICKVCWKEYYASYYKNNPKEKERLARNRDIERERIRQYVREIKSVPCTDCGVQYPYYIMSFDHLPGHEKVGDIARMVVTHSMRKVQAEIAKCEVVCANCHGERTWQRLPGNSVG